MKGPSFSLRAVGNLSEILSREGRVQSCILHVRQPPRGLKEAELEEYEEPLHPLDEGK